MNTRQTSPRAVRDLDWARWTPTVRATLLFVVRAGQVLLIRKKRGLGAGKINGPGGKLDPGETPLQAALRETDEEVGVRAPTATHRGTLDFQFVDGLAMRVEVFVWDAPADAVIEPVETDEALPLWAPLTALPLDEMWADDALWLAHALSGRSVRLQALFEGDVMLDAALELDAV